jgi:hypothetical protein
MHSTPAKNLNNATNQRSPQDVQIPRTKPDAACPDKSRPTGMCTGFAPGNPSISSIHGGQEVPEIAGSGVRQIGEEEMPPI